MISMLSRQLVAHNGCTPQPRDGGRLAAIKASIKASTLSCPPRCSLWCHSQEDPEKNRAHACKRWQAGKKQKKKRQTLEWLDIRHLWLHLVPEVYGPFPLHCLERIWELKKGVIWIQYLSHKKKQIPVPKASMSPMIWFQISVLGHRWLQHKNRKLLSTMPCCNKGSHCRSCRSAGFRFWTTNLSQSTHVENQLSCIRDDGLLFHLLQSSWAEAWQGIWLVGGEIPNTAV